MAGGTCTTQTITVISALDALPNWARRVFTVIERHAATERPCMLILRFDGSRAIQLFGTKAITETIEYFDANHKA